MKTLAEIATFYKTDKEISHNVLGQGHRYCNFYDHHLSSMRFENLKILEIGIFDGGSLKMWEEYFPNSQIYGVDIDPNSNLINENRIRSYLLDASDRDQVNKFIEAYGPFDIVIDDGSHFTNHQWISWEIFSNNCKVFIWEDLHTSRLQGFLKGTNEFGEYPLDAAIRMSKNEKNCFLFDRDGDEKHVTFLKKNEY